MKTNPPPGVGPGGPVSGFGGLTGTSLGIISDSLIAACAKILTAHLGPIAPVVARRSAAKAPSRSIYFDALEGAIADPAKRKSVRAQLDKLP
mgnify:CR=1 FL=1